MRAFRSVFLVLVSGALARAGVAVAAPPPPAGPHPRIALSAPALGVLKAKVGDASSATAAAIAECRKAAPTSGDSSGYQGDAWAFPASACALAWQLTRDPAFAARGIKLWRALLEDVARIGDGKACVAGASPERTVAAIERDTGYALRFIGPHAALAYDWLHDAPGVDEGLRRQSRTCFRAWLDWYGMKGYLRDQPGGNYHAAFVLAKTLIAIATAGEDGATSERNWRETVDDLFGAQIIANGLAADKGGAPQGRMHGALLGGDWPEGWQYGPLSVIEYAFAARVLEDQRVGLPQTHAWADDLTVRFLHGVLPDRGHMYVGGDTEEEAPFLPVSGGPLLATLLGPSSPRVAGWAAFLRAQLDVRRYGPVVFDALAEARAVTPADPLKSPRPPWFLARGTRNLYVRSGWNPGAFWAVFTSAPRLVDDHQHVDASNFVFARGADPLIVDPTPYGSRSTLTSNALSVDSDVVQDRYKPSQTFWGTAELPWARAVRSGITTARADVGPAFAFNNADSDVPLARRDWVFLPEGELVVIDRALTGGAGRSMYLRFRTPVPLSLSLNSGSNGTVARGASGASSVAIHAVTLRPGASPTVVARPKTGECADRAFGACTAARFPVGEYAVKLTGAQVLAVHVVDGLAKTEAPAAVTPLGGVGSSDAVIGVVVRRGGKTTYVVGDSATSARPAGALSYRTDGKADGKGTARHVVFDAPEDKQGRAAVGAEPTGDGNCLVTLSASGPRMLKGRPVIFVTAPAASGCSITEDADVLSDGTAGGAPLPSGARPASRAEVKARKIWKRIAGLHPRRYLKRVAAAAFVGLAGLMMLVWLRRRSASRRPAGRVRGQGT
jgi:hypothetical protein